MGRPGELQSRLYHTEPASDAEQGDKLPWQHSQDYWSDKDTIPAADLDDGTLVYESAGLECLDPPELDTYMQGLQEGALKY